jgi:hypothetical protein
MGYFKRLAIELEEKALLQKAAQCPPDCSECGGMGYTLEPNSEDGETMVGCMMGWQRALEASELASSMDSK